MQPFHVACIAGRQTFSAKGESCSAQEYLSKAAFAIAACLKDVWKKDGWLISIINEAEETFDSIYIHEH